MVEFYPVKVMVTGSSPVQVVSKKYIKLNVIKIGSVVKLVDTVDLKLIAFIQHAGSSPVGLILLLINRQLSEWFKVIVLKTVVLIVVPWVRIPHCL